MENSMASRPNVAFCSQAPYYKSLGKGDPTTLGWRYSFDNGFVLKWRNKADTADISVLRVDEFDRVQFDGLLNLSNITPGTETSGSLLSNDQRWSTAVGTLVSIAVAANVGTATFSAAHGKIVGDKITVSGATVDTDLNATYTVASVPSATTLTFATSNVTAATYTDALLVVTAWQTFATAGAVAVKLLAANISPTGGFATMRLRARSDVATPTWNTRTVAIDCSASANIADYGELCGGSFYAQDNGYAQSRASHWSLGAEAVMACTGTSAGLRFAFRAADYSTTKATLGQYLVRLESAGTGIGVTKDGIFDISPCSDYTYLFKFETAGGFLTDSTGSKSTDVGCLKVKTPVGDKYINLYT
jgi:hypothetical protein